MSLNIKNIDIDNLAIPDPSFLTETYGDPDKLKGGELTKHKSAYEAFCRWSALPKEERDPATEVAFEKKYHLSKGYGQHFKLRKDFQNKRLTYFWEWMMEKLPDVVYSQYKKVMADGNTNAAKFFAELIAKKLEDEKPLQIIQPLSIVGVPQDKIDKLFTPKSYDKKGIIPIDEAEVEK